MTHRLATLLAFVSLLFNIGCASTLTSCLRGKDQGAVGAGVPYRSFVGVASTTTFLSTKCADGVTPPCIDEKGSLGSGTIIYRSESSPNIGYVLTAKHICDHKDERPEGAIDGIPVDHRFSIMDQDGTQHDAKYYFSSSKNLVDACILIFEDMDDSLAVAKVASRSPKQGELAYNVAAPGGFLLKGVALTFSGIYAGNDGAVDIYSIPSAGGSSGSPIFNVAGEVIGMIWGYPVRMGGMRIIEPISYSVTHQDIVDIVSSISSADVIIDDLKSSLKI